MSSSRLPLRYWLRRSRKIDNRWYLSWHSYATQNSRDEWAAKYRKRGDNVWEQPDWFVGPHDA